MRARFRLHFGTVMECQYRLSTYGIAPGSLPIDMNGKLILDRQQQWVSNCEMMEKCGIETPNRAANSTSYTPNDVLVTGAKNRSHSGNRYFQRLIQEFLSEYTAGTDEKKRLIVSMVVEKVQKTGGRFLKQESDSATWVELLPDELRKKVMQAFRNRRRAPRQRSFQLRAKDNSSYNHLYNGD